MAEYADNFERADSDALGGSWVEDESIAQLFRIVSEQLRVDNSTIQGGWAKFNQPVGNDQFCAYTARTAQRLLSPAMLSVRGSGSRTSFTGYAVMVSAFGGGADIVRYDAQNLVDGSASPVVLGSSNLGSFPVVAGDMLMLIAIGTRIRFFRFSIQRPGTIDLVVDATDAIITSGATGVISDAALQELAQDYDGWRAGDIAAAAWFLNDSVPVSLAQQFGTPPAAQIPLDLAPLPLALMAFDAVLAPWANRWWGGLATMHMEPAAGPSAYHKAAHII